MCGAYCVYCFLAYFKLTGSFGAGVAFKKTLAWSLKNPRLVTISVKVVQGRVPVPVGTLSCSSALHTSATRRGYKYVNPDEPSMKWKDIEDRAVATMFWTELFRGTVFIRTFQFTVQSSDHVSHFRNTFVCL